ncbi:MAG: family 16 glycoside hydrolase [Phycisphaerales bacterium]
MHRHFLLVTIVAAAASSAFTASASAPLESDPPGSTPATPAPPTSPPIRPATSDRAETRALLATVKVPLVDAIEAARRETGGFPVSAALKRKDGSVVYDVRLLVGDGERSVEIDAIAPKSVTVREALLTDRRRRVIAELRPLLATAKVDCVEAVDRAMATLRGSRFLSVESDVEHDLLRFAVTLLSDQGLAKVEVDAATGTAGTPVTEVPKPVEDPNVTHFDRDPTGSLPDGWIAAGTNLRGVGAAPPRAATWAVVVDETAPSAPNVLALTSTNHESADAFNICWTDRVRTRNGRIEARFKAVSGEGDQGGGLAWHVRDKDNYHVCRMNPLEENFRLYVVEGGVRRQLASAKAKAKTGEWHTIGVRFVGDRIECSLDGQRLLEARDSTFPGAGGIGFWTKGDAVTRFDDLRIEVLPDDALPVEAPAPG